MGNIAVAKAVDFLRRAQDIEGGWASFVGLDHPHSESDIVAMSLIIEALLKSGEPRNSQLFKHIINVLLKHRKTWKEPIVATSVLNILLLLGYPLDYEYVKELVTNLIETQRSDGGWGWMCDSPSSPAQTLDCIKILRKCKIEISR